MQQYFIFLLFVMILIGCCQLANAQTGNSNLVGNADTLLRQLIRTELLHQLQQDKSTSKLIAGKHQAALQNPILMDSLQKMVSQQLNKAETGISSIGTALVNEATKVPEQLLKRRFAELIQQGQFNRLINKVVGVLRQPVFQLKNGRLNLSGAYAPVGIGERSLFANDLNLAADLSMLGVPLNIQFARQDRSGYVTLSGSRFSIQFDRDNYIRSLRTNLLPRMKTSTLLPELDAALLQLKNETMSKLRSLLASLRNNCAPGIKSQMDKLGNAEEIFSNETSALRNKIFSPSFAAMAEQARNQLMQLQQSMNRGLPVNKHSYDSLTTLLDAPNQIERILSAVQGFKEAVNKSGLLNKLKTAEQDHGRQLQDLLQNPAQITAMAREELDLNAIQKIFLPIQQLSIGINTVELSPLSVNQYLNNGFNATFLSNKTFVFVMGGRQSAIDVFPVQKPTVAFIPGDFGLRVGKGSLSETHTHLSLFRYHRQTGLTTDGIHLPGNTTVATISGGISISPTNRISVELSRSSHQFMQSTHNLDAGLSNLDPSLQESHPKRLTQQMAVTASWSGENELQDLNYSIHTTLTGSAYTNPGSFMLSSGMQEAEGYAKKSFLKRRLDLSARASLHQYSYADHVNWRNYQLYAQAKWRLPKGQFIALSYQPSKASRSSATEIVPLYKNSRLSVETNIRSQWRGVSYQHLLSLSAIGSTHYKDSLQAGGNGLNINSMQTFFDGGKSYFLSAQYYHPLAAQRNFLLNTQLNLEAGLTYRLLKGIQCSTGINYNQVKGWLTQIAVRQSVSGQLNNQCAVSVSANLSKNLQHYLPADPNMTRIDWTLQYLLK